MKNAAKFWRNFAFRPSISREKVSSRLMKNAANFWRNFAFLPSISREIGHKKFHTNSSAHHDLKFHAAEPKFFHNDTLGVGGPKVLPLEKRVI